MDYNIYIHDKTSGQNKPTTPRKSGSTNTMPKQAKEEETSEGEKLDLFSKFKSSTKSGGVIMAVFAAIKVAKGVVDTIEPFVSRETGDYRFSVAYKNAETIVGIFKNPVGYAMGKISYYQEMRLYNQKQEQQRMLIGDSFVNSMSRKV